MPLRKPAETTLNEALMSVTLDLSDRLAELLRALAARRGVSVEELGAQALAMGLTALAGGATDIVDIGLLDEGRAQIVQLASPTLVSGPLRPLQLTFESAAEGSADAH